jgi:hypothetical protein
MTLAWIIFIHFSLLTLKGIRVSFRMNNDGEVNDISTIVYTAICIVFNVMLFVYLDLAQIIK